MAQGGSGSGTEGEYDGGAKRAHLFLFEAAAQQGEMRVCLGFVGQENKRFCLRQVTVQDPSSGIWFCGVQRHLVRFEPQDNTFYPRTNEIIGFCSPSFPIAIVPVRKLEEIRIEKKTIQEWAWLFKSFLTDTEDEDAPSPLKQLGLSVPVPLKTPSKHEDALLGLDRLIFYTPDGVKDVVRASQLNQSGLGITSWDAMDTIPGLPSDVFAFLKSTNAFMLDFENWWKQPFSDYSKLISTIQADLHVLKKSCESLALSVGTPAEIDELCFPDAWNAIVYAAHYFASSPELTSINNRLTAHQTTFEQMPQMWAEVQALHADMVSVLETIDKFENRFVAIQPILQSIHTLQQTVATLSQNPPTGLPQSLHGSPPTMFTRPSTPARQTQFLPITPSASSDSDSSIRLNTLEEKIRRLEIGS
jgi:hypothetical protein